MLYGINWLSDKQSNLDHLNVETLKCTVLGKTNLITKIQHSSSDLFRHMFSKDVYLLQHFRPLFKFTELRFLLLSREEILEKSYIPLFSKPF